MKKSDSTAFSDFILDEATRYGRAITKPEIETYFENFARTTLEDFKTAWVDHKRDPKSGQFFPKIVDLQRILRTTGEDRAERDWRCSAQVGEERCGYPGGIIPVGGKPLCAPHYRIFGSTDYSDAKALQIIEASRSYVPPKTAAELMDRGEAIRALMGKRWRDTAARKATERAALAAKVERLEAEGADPQSVAALAEREMARLQVPREDVEVDVNALAALAAEDRA